MARAAARAIRKLTPATDKVPPDAGKSPQSILKVVDLPAPLGPSNPKISPFLTVKEVLSTATKSPNVRNKFST